MELDRTAIQKIFEGCSKLIEHRVKPALDELARRTNEQSARIAELESALGIESPSPALAAFETALHE